MARNYATLTNSAKVALAAGVAKTVIQLVSATNIRLAIQAITVSFDGTSNTATPVEVLVQKQSTAGTATARTPVKKDGDIASALQATGQENATVEPTAAGDHLRYLVHPQAGVQYPLPIPGELIVPGGGRVGVTINAPAAVNAETLIEFEE